MRQFETYRPISEFNILSMTDKEPCCWNDEVKIKRYKVTIEEIEEPVEVYAERLQKLWEECDNYHHRTPIQNMAKSLGIKLAETYGSRGLK